ncbi:MAG TPA: hypothetical protein VGB85_05940 [Nannocystis sp.]
MAAVTADLLIKVRVFVVAVAPATGDMPQLSPVLAGDCSAAVLERVTCVTDDLLASAQIAATSSESRGSEHWQERGGEGHRSRASPLV